MSLNLTKVCRMNSIGGPIIPHSLVNEAFDRMLDAIVRGQIAPGERLREAQLAKEMGISRGVLREAMQRLEARKLVQRTPNIGVQVIALSEEDLEELYDVREALEGMAARLAASNMAEKDIKRLSSIIEKHARSEGVKKGESYFQGGDEDFHTLIAEGSRNKRLIQALGHEIHHQLRFYRFRSSERRGRTHEALEEHRAIVAAIAARDPDAAEAAMRRHLSNARAFRAQSRNPENG